MSERTVVHHTFVIERTYAAAASRVFAAFADPGIKRRWFVDGEGWEVEAFNADFRVGGRESSRFRFGGGEEVCNETVYQDIVPDCRIVMTYTMTVGGKRISASLATIELRPSGKGTTLVYTEQGAFLDGLDKPGEREHGWGELLDSLEKELARK